MTEIKLRKANLTDSKDILNWRNDQETLKVSFNQLPISVAEHEKWFTGALSDPRRRLFIAETKHREKIGLIRFDLLGARFAEVSLNLVPSMRGKGYGAKIIALGTSKMRGITLLARAKESNPASIRVFEKAGYSRLFSYKDNDLVLIQVLGMAAR